MFGVFFKVDKPDVADKWIFLKQFPYKPMAEGYVKEAERYSGYNRLLGIRFEVREVP